MRWKAALVMGVLAALVIVAIVFQGDVPEIDPEARKEKIFPNFQAERVEEIRLVRHGKSPEPADTVVLALRGDDWRMEKPVACRVEDWEVKGLLSSIADAEPERNTPVIEPEKGEKLNLARFGLEAPRAEVTYRMKGGKPPVTFLIGKDEGGENGGAFLKRADKEAVYIVSKKLIGAILLPADKYRDKRVFDLKAAEVDGFEVDFGEGRVAFRKREGDLWRLTSPVSDRGNRNKIEALRDRLLEFKLAEFAREEIKNPAKYGFDKPTARIAMSAGRKQRQELIVGKVVEGDFSQRWARRAGLPFLYRLKKSEFDELRPKTNDYRDTALESFTKDKVVEIQAVPLKGQTLTFVRDPAGWQIRTPKPAPADRNAVERVLEGLGKLQIKAFVADDGKDLDRWGLAKPFLRVKIQLEEESSAPPEEGAKEKKTVKKVLGDLLFGNVCPAGTIPGVVKGRTHVYAKRAADPGVFAVESTNVDRLLDGPLSFRDKRVFKLEKKEKIAGLRVRRGRLHYAAERKDNKWRLTSPVGEEADDGAVRRIIDRLSGLVAQKVVAEDPDARELGRYGLTKPNTEVELTVSTDGDPVRYRLLLGKPSAGGGVYARRSDTGLVYELPKYVADDLSAELVRRGLLDVPRHQVKSITVKSRRQELVLVRTGAGWNIEKPAPAGAADAAAVSGILNKLYALRAKSVADYAPKSLRSYGLEKDKAVATVTIETEKGVKHVLLLGRGLRGGKERYAKVPGRASVFVIPGAVAEAIERRAKDLRKKEKKPEKKPPVSKTGKLPRVKIKTNQGDIVVDLFEDDAPNTVANFIELAERKFYDGLVFHRVIKGFMLQAGCPRGDGSGNPGYRFADEIDADALGLGELIVSKAPFFDFLKRSRRLGGDGCPRSYWKKPVKAWYEKRGYRYKQGLSAHKMTRGTLAMANSGPNTNGSQFFIVTAKAREYLDGKHTIFGRVVEGMKVVDKIEKVRTYRRGRKKDRPIRTQTIVKVEVLSKRDHEYKVKRLK